MPISGDLLGMHVDQHRADQPDHGRGIGKDPDAAAAALALLVERAHGLADQILRQWAVGNPVQARTSAFASSISGPTPGNDVAIWSRTSSQAWLTASGGENGAEHRRNHVGVALGDVGEQVTGEMDPAALMRGVLEGPHQLCPAANRRTTGCEL